MTAPAHLVKLCRSRRRPAAAWAGLLAGAGLLAVGCSATGPAPSSDGTGRGAMAAPAPARGSVPAAGSAAPARGASLAALPLPGGQSVIFTASLSLRAANVAATAARATRLAESAGGYVSGEHTTISHGRRASTKESIVFKVPVAAYPGTLGALAGLGTLRSETQQAQDVTGVVADVASRVSSARAAIAQLRKLLARAGSVGSLLDVQGQINAEEASLEALQSQQRALARETSYATISLAITGRAPPPARRHRGHGPAGFAGGLAAGWRDLRVAVSWMLTGAGAALPFAVPVAVVALAGLAARRWLGRRRASTRPAG